MSVNRCCVENHSGICNPVHSCFHRCQQKPPAKPAALIYDTEAFCQEQIKHSRREQIIIILWTRPLPIKTRTQMSTASSASLSPYQIWISASQLHESAPLLANAKDGGRHRQLSFMFWLPILVFDPNIDCAASHRVFPVKRKCCFQAVPSFYYLFACNCKLYSVKSIEVCKGNSKQIKHRGSSRGEKTINERRTGHKNRTTKDLNPVEEDVLSSTTADNDES